MYLLIRYPGGIIVEGVVLAKGSKRLRVAAAGFPETIEPELCTCAGSSLKAEA